MSTQAICRTIERTHATRTQQRDIISANTRTLTFNQVKLSAIGQSESRYHRNVIMSFCI